MLEERCLTLRHVYCWILLVSEKRYSIFTASNTQFRIYVSYPKMILSELSNKQLYVFVPYRSIWTFILFVRRLAFFKALFKAIKTLTSCPWKVPNWGEDVSKRESGSAYLNKVSRNKVNFMGFDEKTFVVQAVNCERWGLVMRKAFTFEPRNRVSAHILSPWSQKYFFSS